MKLWKKILSVAVAVVMVLMINPTKAQADELPFTFELKTDVSSLSLKPNDPLVLEYEVTNTGDRALIIDGVTVRYPLYTTGYLEYDKDFETEITGGTSRTHGINEILMSGETRTIKITTYATSDDLFRGVINRDVSIVCRNLMISGTSPLEYVMDILPEDASAYKPYITYYSPSISVGVEIEQPYIDVSMSLTDAPTSYTGEVGDEIPVTLRVINTGEVHMQMTELVGKTSQELVDFEQSKWLMPNDTSSTNTVTYRIYPTEEEFDAGVLTRTVHAIAYPCVSLYAASRPYPIYFGHYPTVGEVDLNNPSGHIYQEVGPYGTEEITITIQLSMNSVPTPTPTPTPEPTATPAPTPTATPTATPEPTAVAYEIIQGNGQTITKGSNGIFVSNAPFEKFTSVMVDGAVVGTEHYTAVSGSTKVEFKGTYTNTLAIGNHTIEIVSNDGTASGTFKIQQASTTTPTTPVQVPVVNTGVTE